MILYTFPSAPNPRRVDLFLAEKGIAVERRIVDLAAGEQLSSEFRTISSRCVVPTLVLDSGEAIDESLAICRYFEEICPQPRLMGVDAVDKARVTMWERRMEFDGFLAAVEAVRNHLRGLAGRALVGPHGFEQIPALVERGRARLAIFHSELDARLANSPFIAGDAFTIADITALVTIDFAESRLKLPPASSLDSLARWRAQINQRPGIAAA